VAYRVQQAGEKENEFQEVNQKFPVLPVPERIG
jgi:hypothetical protein